MFIEMFVYTSLNVSMLKVYIIFCKMVIDYNTVWVTYMFILRHRGTYMIIIQHGELICFYYSMGKLYDYNMTFLLF